MVDLRPGPMVVETPPQALGMFDDRWWQWIVDFGLPGPGHLPRGGHRGMVIAPLAVLGVDLIVIAVLGVLLSRRRLVSRQSGAFKGAVRVVDGEVPGPGRKWQRGYGR
jgi:hypothetical protein